MAVFTVVHRVLLNPLPYPDSSQVIWIDHGAPAIGVPSGIGLTAGLYHHYLDRARTLDGLAIFRLEGLTLGGDGGGVAYMPTSRVLGGLMDLFDPAFLDDPRLAQVLPAALIAWYRTDEGQWFKEETARDFGGLPDARIRTIGEGELAARRQRATTYVARLFTVCCVESRRRRPRRSRPAPGSTYAPACQTRPHAQAPLDRRIRGPIDWPFRPGFRGARPARP